MTDWMDGVLEAFTAEELAVLRTLARATGHGDDLAAYLIARAIHTLPGPWGRA